MSGAHGSETPVLHARKSLGQNYLRDKNIARRIVDTLKAEPGDAVLEIGPGPGALTGHLAAGRPGRLVLVEKDPVWAFARRRDMMVLPEIAGGVVVADALALAWEGCPDSWKIIGNLPYNVASPLLWEICGRAGFARAVFMIQKEVGERITAAPGSRAYGALSVWLRSFVRPKLEFLVPPQVFYPRPKVYSAVLSFTPLAAGGEGGPPPALRPALAALLKRCFQQRRKQLGTILRGERERDGRLWEKSGLDPALRPENLTPADFLGLVRILREDGAHKKGSPLV